SKLIYCSTAFHSGKQTAKTAFFSPTIFALLPGHRLSVPLHLPALLRDPQTGHPARPSRSSRVQARSLPRRRRPPAPECSLQLFIGEDRERMSVRVRLGHRGVHAVEAEGRNGAGGLG